MKTKIAQNPKVSEPRSIFDRGFRHVTTFEASYLVPIYVDHVLPGDTLKVKMRHFARLTTPIVPIMDNLFLQTFFFFVPYRLIFDNFQKMMGEQVDPGDSTDFVFPVSTAPSGGYQERTLQDYMGLPTQVEFGTHNTLPLRSYNLIYNTWFRSEDLQDSVTVDKGDGPDTVTNYVLLRRGARPDYFTSNLPWPQKNDNTLIPMAASGSIISNNEPVQFRGVTEDVDRQFYVRTSDAATVLNLFAGGSNQNVKFGTETGLELDLNVEGTINALRTSVGLTHLFERDARYGTRYTEIIRGHFGVISPDARLQRPEYLGGGRSFMNITPVAQTSSTDTTTPQGNLSAFGTSADTHGFSQAFSEHGTVIGLVNVYSPRTYCQGLDRFWSKSTRWDLYWPDLAHLGERATLTQEIVATANPTTNATPWGYLPQYEEYRRRNNMLTGDMRFNSPDSLDIWHLGKEYLVPPNLDGAFIQDVTDEPLDRALAINRAAQVLLDADFDIQHIRPVPMYGIPGLNRL